MAITINGTTGISGVDGSASTPALQGADTNTGLSFGTDIVNINTGGSTRATVDSAGKLLVGASSTSATHTLQVQADGNANAIAILGRSSDDIGELGFYENDASTKLGELQYRTTEASLRHRVEGADLLFATTASGGSVSTRMKVLSTGQVHVGPHSTPFTTNSLFNIQRTNGMLFSMYHDGTDDNPCGVIRHQRSDGSTYGKMLQFNNTSGSAVGSIAGNGSSTNYNTSSDYRLKENVTAISDGITRLKTLKPSRFNFKVDKDTTVDGFLAHEVTAVPEAISGTKDEVDSDNKPVYQGIDQSKLVPLLTAALQEAIGKIETLETKVAALEAA